MNDYTYLIAELVGKQDPSSITRLPSDFFSTAMKNQKSDGKIDGIREGQLNLINSLSPSKLFEGSVMSINKAKKTEYKIR